jgi:type I restriction enzyme S subunit
MKDGVSAKFIYFVAQTVKWAKLSEASGVPSLNSSIILKVDCPVPSLPEQEKIAGFFSALDERITLTAEKVDLLKEQKQGYLQSVFARELAFTDEKGDTYPEWEQKKLHELAAVTSGKRLPKGHQFVSSGTPYITVSDMGDKKVDQKQFSFISPATETVLQRYKVTEGDIIISIAGTLGKVNLVDTSIEQANLTENCDKIRVNEGIIPEFIYYVLKSPSIQSDIGKTSTTSSQPKLALEQLRNFSIPLPSLSEQEKISEFFSALDEQIELAENKLTLLKEQKKGYLQGIFG